MLLRVGVDLEVPIGKDMLLECTIYSLDHGLVTIVLVNKVYGRRWLIRRVF